MMKNSRLQSSKTLMIPFVRVSVDIEERDIKAYSYSYQKSTYGQTTTHIRSGTYSTSNRIFNSKITIPCCNYLNLRKIAHNITDDTIVSKRYDDYAYVQTLNHEIVPSDGTWQEMYESYIYLIVSQMFSALCKKYVPIKSSLILINTFWLPFDEIRVQEDKFYYTDYQCQTTKILEKQWRISPWLINAINLTSGCVGALTSAVCMEQLIQRYSLGKTNQYVKNSAIVGGISAFAGSALYLYNYYSKTQHPIVQSISNTASNWTNKATNLLEKLACHT